MLHDNFVALTSFSPEVALHTKKCNTQKLNSALTVYYVFCIDLKTNSNVCPTCHLLFDFL
jgi:hypothetical protein